MCIRLADTVSYDDAQGRIRWYLHPDLPSQALRTTLVYRYEIPPRSATGKQRIQGNVAGYVVAGAGSTVVDGERHTWAAGDVIGLPPRLNGLVVQHFNSSDDEAVIVFAEPNFLGAFGPDMGSGFEQIAPHPRYEQRNTGSAEVGR